MLAIEALQSCGLSDFRLEIGHIGLFNTLIRRLNLSEEDAEEIRTLIQTKNFPSLNDRLDKLADQETASMLKKLPALFGGEEVFAQAAEVLYFPELAADMELLHSIYQSLSQLGLGDKLSIDLGIVNRNDYYTGIVFRGYVEGLGTTALLGGRYDTLLSEYGSSEPAIGFSIDVDAVAKVLKAALPALSAAAEYDNLIILKTCSKALGMAALRVGFAVANPRLAIALKAAKSPYNVNAVSQAMAACLLRKRDLLERCRMELIENTAALRNALADLAKEFPVLEEVYPTCTNFVFLRSSKGRELQGKLLERSIAVRCFGGYLRITTGSAEENRAFLSALRDILIEMEGFSDADC